MNEDFLYYVQKPFLKERNGIVLDVNNNFLTLTQFCKNELCGKNIDEVLNILFRSNHKINIYDKEIKIVLFTKTLDVRFVKINKYSNFENNINIFFFNEIENSRLDDKLVFVKSLINDNKIGIAIYTAEDLKLIKANQKYLDYMPKPFNSKEAIYGKCLNEFIHNFKKTSINDIFSKVIQENKPIYLSEYSNQFLENTNYWDSTITPVSDNGKVKYIMTMLEEVTDRVLNRKHIQLKGKQFESVLESVEDEISIIDKDGKYLVHSNFIKKLFTPNMCNSLNVSNNFGKFYDLYDNPLTSDDLCFTKLLKGEKIKNQRLKYVYNNTDYYLSITGVPIFDDDNNFDMGVLVTQDITELIKSNEQIANHKKELEIIFDNMSDGLAVIDKYGNYIKKNNALKKSLEKFSNLGSLNRVGETLMKGIKYYNENDEELTLEQFPPYKVLKGKTVIDQRIMIKKDFSNVYLDFNAIPIFGENGNFQYGIIFSHDITHIIKNSNRIKQEQQLIIKSEHEKLETAKKTLIMKDEFISLISHEFKTPLNVIFSALQLIEYSYVNTLPDKVKNLMTNIKQNTYRQLRLVNNLLDITKLNSETVKINIKNIDIVSLTRHISYSVKLYCNQRNIKLFFKCSLLYKNIATDNEKLERILLNLLSNAIKFTDYGGTVIINLYEDKKTNTLAIEVSDTGVGIPKDKQKLIFEKFGQVDNNLSRRAEGTGIGLSLVKKLVDVLNGKIELESEPEHGSTFRIILPIKQALKINTQVDYSTEKNRLVNSMNVEFSDIYL